MAFIQHFADCAENLIFGFRNERTAAQKHLVVVPYFVAASRHLVFCGNVSNAAADVAGGLYGVEA